LRIFENQEKIRLGIDEHSISGRRKMALLIVELVSSTPVAILPTHRKEELLRFLNKIPSYTKRKIDEVVIDLNQGYKNAIKKALPHVRIVADPFHLVRDANKRLDDERRIAEEVYFALNNTRTRREVKNPDIVGARFIEPVRRAGFINETPTKNHFFTTLQGYQKDAL